MEKYFKPVHSPSALDEIKPQKQQHHHQLHHHQDTQSHRYIQFHDDRNTDESHGHHHHHRHHLHHAKEDEILYNHHTPVTLSRASFSLSSSSSSSTSPLSSWCTEASENDPFFLRHAERPQHSLSCSNIPDVRRVLREDDGREPIVFVTIKHSGHGGVHTPRRSSQQRVQQGFSSLHRGHSRSDEGLLQSNEINLRDEQHKVPHMDMDYGPLYKTASLSRSLVFSEEDILLGVSRGLKRAVSSSQLPSKGILKNRGPPSDIRKAKSMEVLSPRVAKGQAQHGEKGKRINEAESDQARKNFLQGKLQFSAFLDEITKQVISPSDLNILGVNNIKTSGKISDPAQTPGPVKPQLPPKKHRESSGEERESHLKQPSKQEKTAHSKHQPQKHSNHSNPDKLISYGARDHSGSPLPHHFPHPTSHNTHHRSSHKDRHPLPTEGPRDRRRCSAHLTEGASTSPEPQPEQSCHLKQQPTTSHISPPHPQPFPQQPGHRGTANSPPPPAQSAGAGLGSESPSSKSDSSRSRDADFTATSHGSELCYQHHSQNLHTGPYKQHRDTLYDVDQLQALQDENADLHQNLLQTVVCIESLEAELQRTREELSHVKEKYKSLLDTHSGTRPANNLLGEHLHDVSGNLSSERTYLLNRVAQLSSELQDAHRTIAALENINVPCLIKELVEEHFDSAEAIHKFLKTAAPVVQSATAPQVDNQSRHPKKEEAAYDWSKSEAGPQRVTAFMPWKQGGPTIEAENHILEQHDFSPKPPFSVADISADKKMAANYAASSQLLYQDQQEPSPGTNHVDTPPNLQQAHVHDGKGGAKTADLELDAVDVTSVSAQQILDDFMQQLHTHKEPGEEKEQQGGQE
ncbi:hypothetical protein LDENG_00019510 [Lucifuga dentata]|nr:hypothetical protein LDENG_00019510 [Lucifuga dentata]